MERLSFWIFKVPLTAQAQGHLNSYDDCYEGRQIGVIILLLFITIQMGGGGGVILIITERDIWGINNNICKYWDWGGGGGEER